MHSLAMSQDILEAALTEAEKHNAKHVKAISVKIGGEHFTGSDSLQFYLEATAKATIAEGEGRIATRWTGRGTHTRHDGHTSTQKQVTAMGVTIDPIVDGKLMVP